MLGFSSFEYEESQNADAHRKYIDYALNLFNRSFENVVAITGDNCSVNRSIARKLEIKFVGCASRRYNLALKDLFVPKSACIEKVHSIMKALKLPIVSAKLRKLTHLRPKCHVPTRWSSSAEMLRRYIELKEAVTKLDAVQFDVTLPTNRENEAIETLCKKYGELDSVTKLLQKGSTTCATVRAVFDEVMKDYPDTSGSLGASASTVHDPVFERALVKLQNQRFESLNPEEKDSVTNLMSSQSDIMSSSTNFGDLSIVERASVHVLMNQAFHVIWIPVLYYLPPMLANSYSLKPVTRYLTKEKV